MIQIAVKIKSEDKKIMINFLKKKKEKLTAQIHGLNALSDAAWFELSLNVFSKLMASHHNDNPIHLTLLETMAFKKFIEEEYFFIGDYERANADTLLAQIREKVQKAVLKLKNMQ